jgi:parallel beta-helix repeat protein
MKRTPFGAAAGTLLATAALLLALAGSALAHGRGHHHHHHHRHHHDATIVRPGESIQAAVDAAEPGSTIVVERGTYAENVAITTDGITLKGRGARLVPPESPTANACSFGQPSGDGICAIGQGDFSQEGPSTVTDPVSDVTIKGFKVSGFPGIGILFLGAENPVIEDNRTKDNGAYGIARFVSSGGAILGNEATGSGEAGIYVGDSPDADVLVAGNRSFDNILFGFFLRDAANGRVVGNESTGNCVGAIVLNTGANIAGDWRFFANRLHDNDRFCPGDEEEGTPPLSGIGVAIANASGNVLIGTLIKDNNPSGEGALAGGVVIVDAGTPGANPPSDNLVKRNVILGNEPDIFWDGSGTGNVIERNLCETSVPEGLCEDRHGHHGRDHEHGRDEDHHGRHHDHGDRHDDHGDRHDDHGNRHDDEDKDDDGRHDDGSDRGHYDRT